VALGAAGAVFPVDEVGWANTGKAIARARIVAPRRATMFICSLPLYSGKPYGCSIDDQTRSATRFTRFSRPAFVALLCCGLWTSPQRRQRYRRDIIAGRPSTRAAVTTRAVKAGLHEEARDFDRLTDA